MTEQLERELERVLLEAGESAPAPPPGLLARLDSRARRRRKTWIQTGAVCLAAAAAVTAIAIAGGGRVPKASPEPAITPSTSTEVDTYKPQKPRPAEQLWPEAVHQLPRSLPDGREYYPITFLDDGNVLIRAYADGAEPVESLNRYDLATREVTKLAEIDMPAQGDGYMVTGGSIVWYSEEETGSEILGIPVGGGEPRRLAVGPAGQGVEGTIAVDGGTVYWSSWTRTSGQIYSAPIGGTGKAMADTKDDVIVSWPWIGGPMPRSEPVNGVLYRDLRNVKTKETRTTDQRDGVWSCDLTWCVGRTGKQTWAERRDGTLRHSVPTIGQDFVDIPDLAPVRDRFMVAGRDVVDVVTGAHGQLATSPDDPGRASVDERLHLSETADGYEIIDLAAIP